MNRHGHGFNHELESEPNKAFVLSRLTASTATLLSIPVTSLEKVLWLNKRLFI